jgi:hypothetical protein
MNELKLIIEILTLTMLGVGAYMLKLFKAGIEEAVKTSAQKAAEETVRQLVWPTELARELQKTRGVERQGLRVKSYGALWKELRPLAIYDSEPLDRKTVAVLSSKLSDWYFSDCGGLFLTSHVRDFYFALQDLLRTIARCPEDWQTERFIADQQQLFVDLCKSKKLLGADQIIQELEKESFDKWPETAAGQAKLWRDIIKSIASKWDLLTPREQFATLQQVGSILRTVLVKDIESRLG